MKKQLIFSLLFVFAIAVFAPAAVQAMDNDVVIVNVDNDEKTEKKAECTEKKAECTEEKKAECTDKKAEAKKGCSAAKSGCGAK